MEKIWLKHYPQGVPGEIHLTGETLVSMADTAFVKYTDSMAFKCHGVSKTFGEISVYVERLAAALADIGVKKGDRIAIIMPNLIQYPVSVFAILKLGAIVVNVNPLYTSSEIEYVVQNSGAKVALVLDLMAAKLNDIYAKGILKEVIVTRVGDIYPWFKRNFFNFMIKYVKRVNVSYAYQAHDFYKLICADKKLSKNTEVLDTDTAFIQYTGATTGKPKGAILTHRNIVANVVQVHAWLEPQVGSFEKKLLIGALPLYHIFSLTANLLAFFSNGCGNVLVTNPRDTKDLIKTLRNNNFYIFNALDTLYNNLLNSPEFAKSKFPAFKYSVAGGMPAHSSTARRWFEVTGVYPSNCYGMTEASPAVTMSVFDNTFDGSVGFPIPSTELQIRNMDNIHEVMPQREIGLVFIRGPQLMSGYWNNPEASKDAFDENGWFNTKDLGYLSEQGKLFLTGRQSDMIIVSGFNVYPAEIEEVLDELPQIKEAAVIGVEDQKDGEAVIAYIVLKPGWQIDELEIKKRCREKLTNYKLPRNFIFVDELPKTLVGKIDKVSLVQQYAKNQASK
ncbi:MAG: long-chain fatty acid--CoA ligase [Burkholderiales bacterium]|jgi:long-chain acyl-CoA synthetase|nr:long-chain fatty acid--CoA ligase [Burkholderiales bacterium]